MDSTILIVDDEPEVQNLIAVNLQRAGYQALRAGNAAEATSLIHRTLPSLVLLDWILPGVLGLTFAKRLRSDARTMGVPIIMLSARAHESDKIAALEAGADDYITKPFSPRELLARIKAVMRRSAPQRTDDVTEVAGLKIDPAARRVTCDGLDIELGDIEFRLLHFLMTHPERIYSRAHLLDEVWGDQVYVEERTVDVHIRRLRQSLARSGRERLIDTVRGLGYRFQPDLNRSEHMEPGQHAR